MECDEDCPRCSGEFCETHGVIPCDCDTAKRHHNTTPRNLVPTLHPNSPAAFVFKALELLQYHDDDFNKVAKDLNVNRQTLAQRLRYSGVRIKHKQPKKDRNLVRKKKYNTAIAVLEESDWNIAAAASKLQINIQTLRIWLKHGPEVLRKQATKQIKKAKKVLQRATTPLPLLNRSREIDDLGLLRLKFLTPIQEISDKPLEEHIKTYQSLSEEEKRDYFENFIPIIKKVVTKIGYKYYVDRESLVYPAAVQLAKILDGFDFSKTTNYEGYVYQKLYFALIDHYRDNESPYPRGIQNKRNELVKFLQGFAQRPQVEEVCEALDWSYAEFLLIVRHVPKSLDTEDNDGASLLDFVENIPEHEIPDLTDDIHEILSKATTEEKKFLTLYYLDDKSMKDVGKIVGLSESRVSQIMGRIIEKIKVRFGI